jgi:hypothetical protein
MIELIEDLPKNVVGIAVRGRVTKAECHQVLVPAIAKSLRWRDKIRLYYELGSRFPGSGWDDLDIGFDQATRCERIAIVTDIAWVRLTVKAIRFLIPGEIRVFATEETAEARTWIAAKPGSRADSPEPAPLRALRNRRLGQRRRAPTAGWAVEATPRRRRIAAAEAGLGAE